MSPEEVLIGFAHALRAAGLGITQDRTASFLQATGIVGAVDRAAVHRAGRATLCAGPDDLARYDHVFEAYVPKAKRQFGYFTLPVLLGDEIIAALDIKADRTTRKLLIQSWHWIGHGAARPHKKLIETELDRFAAFQFGD